LYYIKNSIFSYFIFLDIMPKPEEEPKTRLSKQSGLEEKESG